MNITQLEKEILKAIKIESEELKVLYDKHNEDGEYLLSLKNFVKRLFKEHRNESYVREEISSYRATRVGRLYGRTTNHKV